MSTISGVFGTIILILVVLAILILLGIGIGFLIYFINKRKDNN